MIPKQILQDLNPAQREAVETVHGPMLVVAGAGTGKTRVITRRVASLIYQGVRPEQILAITFTNKAANEMKERVEALIGPSQVTLGTYHSFCARFLRFHASQLGYTGDYTIYDRDDSLALINAILKDQNKDKGSVTAQQILEEISSLKQVALTPQQALDQACNPQEREFSSFYEIYDTRLRLANAMDFDDLLFKTLQLLRQDKNILQEAQNRWQYLLIDEYQDTNPIQYSLIHLLAAHGNVCATGDPDQSIYAWRGADIRNILEFEKDFSEAKIILLEENYRSPGNILKAASAVIAHNTQRKDRELWTQREDGESLSLVVVDSEQDEAREVVRRLQMGREQNQKWTQSAVFYRTNAQTRVLERRLRENGIPYRLVGAVSFFKRREVKDLVAYLILLINPADDQAFLRVINTPRRGLGKTTLDRLISFARSKNISLFEALNHLDQVEGLTRRASEALKRFQNIFTELKSQEFSGVRDQLLFVIETTNFEASLKAEPDGAERLENIQELVTAAREFDLTYPEQGLQDFLADISLLSATELEEGDTQGVTLMTVHSAKGLEFDHVYFVGLEEDLMPHIRSHGDPHALEEERRLMYVAITRSRQTLTLMHTRLRSQWGQTRRARASRFLSEIPEEILNVEDHSTWKTKPLDDLADDMEAGEENSSWGASGDDEFSQVEWEYPVKIGDRVRHARFGAGQVLTVSGRPPVVKVRVRFLTLGVRQLIWGRAPLERV